VKTLIVNVQGHFDFQLMNSSMKQTIL